MPTITVYEQTTRVYWLDAHAGRPIRRTTTSVRAYFEPAADRLVDEPRTVLDDRIGPDGRMHKYVPVEAVVRTHQTGGEVPIRIKIPVDARYTPRDGAVSAAVEWARSPLRWGPLVKDHTVRPYPNLRLDAGDCLKVAREGTRAEAGDTFTIVEAGDVRCPELGRVDEPRPVVDLPVGSASAGGGDDPGRGPDVPRGLGSPAGGDRPEEPRGDGDARAGATADRDDDPSVRGPVADEGLDRRAGVRGGVDGPGPLTPDGSLRLTFARPGLRVIAPEDAEIAGGREAPSLVLSGPRKPSERGPARMVVAWALLPEMARLGWYGLRWEPLDVEADPTPEPSSHVDPYTAERLGGGGKSKPSRKREPAAVATGQGMLF